MAKVNWQGVYPALTTKFKEDHSLDIPAFQKHLDFQLNNGIHGVILAGSLGEASTLQLQETLELLAAAKETKGFKPRSDIEVNGNKVRLNRKGIQLV